MKNAVVLLSGGLDSTTTMAIARSEGYAIYAMTIDYKQRHRAEIEAARKIAESFGARRHVVIDIDLTVFGHSALTAAIDVPRHQTVDEIESGIPITYVPARNTIFLSYALAFAEVSTAGDIFIGVNALDYSGYPDCRGEYIESFQKMANLATKAGVEGTPLNIHVPLIHLSKSEIIRKGCNLGVDYSITHSCYDPLPDGSPCRHCDSCLLRAKGFEEAGIDDPLTLPFQA